MLTIVTLCLFCQFGFVDIIFPLRHFEMIKDKNSQHNQSHNYIFHKHEQYGRQTDTLPTAGPFQTMVLRTQLRLYHDVNSARAILQLINFFIFRFCQKL